MAEPLEPEKAMGEVDGARLSRLAADLRAALAEVGWSHPDHGNHADANVSTLEAQARSPRPNRVIVSEAAKTIRTVLEGAAGNIAASAILNEIGLLLE